MQKNFPRGSKMKCCFAFLQQPIKLRIESCSLRLSYPEQKQSNAKASDEIYLKLIIEQFDELRPPKDILFFKI